MICWRPAQLSATAHPLLGISLKLAGTLQLLILPLNFEWYPLLLMYFHKYNCLKQHCFHRISSSIWLRLKMNTTTHLSDATHFLMRPQNIKLCFCLLVLLCGITSLMSSVTSPILFFSSVSFHLFPLTC